MHADIDSVKTMRSRALNLFVFIVLLIPSAQFAWRSRDMPEFAYLHDDGLLFISAKSLATGNGYRIPSLPENPYQTKFPPLYPWFLSWIWRLNPAFPANLALATLFCWATLAAFLALSWRLFQSDGYSQSRTWILTGLLGLSPYLILFGCTMFTEVFFTSFVLGTLLLARRPGNAAILAAAVVAGFAYLARTAGIALLISVPLWLLWRREAKRALLFLVGMLPFVAAWSVWSRLHHTPSADATLIYYTDYIRYQFLNVDWGNLGLVLWKNADQILYGMGAMALPKVIENGPAKILTQVLGVAMISGIVRLVRKRTAVDYALFAVLSAGILLLWHFPPNERFVLPLAPLLIAGLVTEIEHFIAMLRPAFGHKDFSQRIAAGVLSAGAGVVLAGALVLQSYVSFVFLKQSADQKAAKLASLRQSYQWIASHLPASAGVLSYDDPLLYLYTGRRGNYLPLLPRWWYAEDHSSILGAYRSVDIYCERRGLNFIYFTSDDLSRETGDEDRNAIAQEIRANSHLKPVFSAGMGTIYQVDPSTR